MRNFTTNINEEKNYRELKESIRMKKRQRCAIFGGKKLRFNKNISNWNVM